jgi:hypothetical protein
MQQVHISTLIFVAIILKMIAYEIITKSYYLYKEANDCVKVKPDSSIP